MMADPRSLRTIASLMRPAKGFTLSDAEIVDAAADEIERLHSLVSFHEDQKRQSEAMREAPCGCGDF